MLMSDTSIYIKKGCGMQNIHPWQIIIHESAKAAIDNNGNAIAYKRNDEPYPASCIFISSEEDAQIEAVRRRDLYLDKCGLPFERIYLRTEDIPNVLIGL